MGRGGVDPLLADLGVQLDGVLLDRAVAEHEHRQDAALGASDTRWIDRTGVSAGGGGTTTPVQSVIPDSSRLVASSISSISPWAARKNALTCRACSPRSAPGEPMESTK